MFGFLKYFSCAHINTVYPDLTSINDDFSTHNITYYLVRSEHNIVLKMAKSCPNLLLSYFDIRDIGGNELNDFTIFQYVIWSYDLDMSKLLLSEFPDFHLDFKRQYDEIYARYDNRPHFNLMPYISTLDFYIKNLLIADNIRYSQIFIDLRDKKRQLPYSILRFMKNAAYDYTKFDFNSTQKLSSPKLHENIGNQSGDYCLSEVNRLYDNTLLADDIAYSLDKSTPGQQLNWIKNFLEVRQNQFKVFFSFGECDTDETRMPVYP